MSERKVLNKYYPPDFDPSKIPRMKLPKNRQYTVRLMAPFNMRCATCGEYIYKGKKFNARKEDVENEDYLGIRIYRFYIKCTRCLQEISFKTDPKNTDYEIEAGATRNFMALKLAEEQAQREEEEAREEEANNPMKLLENRTKQSKNEIELLESLEELKDLNKRQQLVDFDTMLQAYDSTLTQQEREEKLKELDEEYIKTVKFANPQKRKVIVEEEVIEPAWKSLKIDDAIPTTSKIASASVSSSSWTINSNKVKNIGVKKSLNGLVKVKTNNKKQSDTNRDSDNVQPLRQDGSQQENNSVKTLSSESNTVTNNSGGSWSLAGAYSDSDTDSNGS